MNDLRNTISDVSRITNQYSGRMNRALQSNGAEFEATKAAKEAAAKSAFDDHFSAIYDSAEKLGFEVEDAERFITEFLAEKGITLDKYQLRNVFNDQFFISELNAEDVSEKRMYI